jgi:hypothetical protein
MRRTLGQKRLHLGPQSIVNFQLPVYEVAFIGNNKAAKPSIAQLFRLFRWAAVPCGHALPK